MYYNVHSTYKKTVVKYCPIQYRSFLSFIPCPPRPSTAGPAWQRISKFGLLQLLYTLITFLCVYPLYGRRRGALALQLFKFTVAMWYGAKVRRSGGGDSG
jgi:hypothetical protein